MLLYSAFFLIFCLSSEIFPGKDKSAKLLFCSKISTLTAVKLRIAGGGGEDGLETCKLIRTNQDGSAQKMMKNLFFYFLFFKQ